MRPGRFFHVTKSTDPGEKCHISPFRPSVISFGHLSGSVFSACRFLRRKSRDNAKGWKSAVFCLHGQNFGPKSASFGLFSAIFANLPIKSVDFKSIFRLFSYLCSAHLRTWEPCRIPDKRRNGNPALVGERRAHRLEGRNQPHITVQPVFFW